MTGIKTWHIGAAAVAACAALTAGLWITVVQPGIVEQDHRVDLRNQLSSRRQKAEELNSNLISAKAQLAALQSELTASPLHLSPESKINQRLAAINELATENGLIFQQIKPGAAADASHFKILPIHVEGTGTYPTCTAFLHALRESFPDTAVATLDATAQPGNNASSGIVFHMELNWYTKK